MKRLSRLLSLIPLVVVAACSTAQFEAAFAPAAKPLAGWSDHDATSTATIDHDAWDAFLVKYLSTDADGVNRVAYGTVTPADDKALRDYIAALEAVDIATFNRNEQYAFWANLYNAVTVRTILDNYPVGSIRNISGGGPLAVGPWGLDLTAVNGRALSLDDIEHGIMRPFWNDPRVHYAVNCAAVGCPNLAMTAFRGATLEAALETQARAFINDPRGVTIADGKITVSSIYAWFEEDFGGTEASVLEHLKRYAEPALKAQLEEFSSIDAYAYDWDLNDQVAPGS